MLKQFVKLFVITFLILGYTNSKISAETNLVYLDLKIIMNDSDAGKKAQDYLTEQHKNNLASFKKTAEKLKKEEMDLIAKKQVMEKEKYKKEIEKLRAKATNFAKERREKTEKLAKTRMKARNELLSAIKPLLEKYSNENNVDLVIDKKNVIIGKSNIDITSTIIKELNQILPSLKLN